MTPTHLVLSGGAFKGISFLGVMECLQRRNTLLLSSINTLAGSSVGGIIAVLIAIGYGTPEIFKFVVDIDFTKMINPDIMKLITHFGLDDGDLIVNKIKEYFTQKKIDPDITFSQLYELTKKRLIITVSCLGRGVRYLDHINEPGLSVITAVRMSFSIPFWFTPILYKGEYYVDGGLLDNVPMALFAAEAPENVLVIRTLYDDDNSPSSIPINFEQYGSSVAQTALVEIERLRLKTIKSKQLNTISVSVGHIKTESMINLTQAEKVEYVKAGYRTAQKYLESNSYLTLKIQSLPHHLLLKIWQYVHNRQYNDVLLAVRKSSGSRFNKDEKT